MKSVLIIGLGRLGHHLCVNMSQLGNEVMIVDRNEECMQDLLPYATMAKVGDCTNEDVLRSLGIGNFEITSLIKEMGAKYVVSKANRDIHAKFLLRNGADEVIYPDRDIAERLAVKHSANHVFDYIELTEGYSIFEIPPVEEWIGKSIRQLAIRSKYHVSILGNKKNGHLQLLPHAERRLEREDHLMVVGLTKYIDRL